MIKTIEQDFEEFAAISGNNCCAEHKAAARRIFFCAASSAFRANADIYHLPADERGPAVQARRAELIRFAEEMKAERERQRACGAPLAWAKVAIDQLPDNPHGRN